MTEQPMASQQPRTRSGKRSKQTRSMDHRLLILYAFMLFALVAGGTTLGVAVNDSNAQARRFHVAEQKFEARANANSQGLLAACEFLRVGNLKVNGVLDSLAVTTQTTTGLDAAAKKAALDRLARLHLPVPTCTAPVPGSTASPSPILNTSTSPTTTVTP